MQLTLIFGFAAITLGGFDSLLNGRRRLPSSGSHRRWCPSTCRVSRRCRWRRAFILILGGPAVPTRRAVRSKAVVQRAANDAAALGDSPTAKVIPARRVPVGAGGVGGGHHPVLIALKPFMSPAFRVEQFVGWMALASRRVG